MDGFVTTRHLLTKWPTILQEFGPRCLMRCVWRTFTAARPVTFLECVPFESIDSSDDPASGAGPRGRGV